VLPGPQEACAPMSGIDWDAAIIALMFVTLKPPRSALGNVVEIARLPAGKMPPAHSSGSGEQLVSQSL